MDVKAKRGIKDSVFTNLFGIKKFTLQLYKALHSDAPDIAESDVEIVTLENILVNNLYNDLSFKVRNEFVFFVEAQSTWTKNIVIRVLLYAALTIKEYIYETQQNLYGSKNIILPKMEFYVLYTGSKQKVPEKITLSDDFFGGEKCDIDVCIHVIRTGKDGDIINQYTEFTRIMDEQEQKYGRTEKAVREAIRICKERGILKEYLEGREKEVVNIMMELFDQEYATAAYTHDVKEEGRAEGVWNTLCDLVKKGLLSVSAAAKQAGMEEAAFEEKYEEFSTSVSP